MVNLLERLGQANFERYLRCQAERTQRSSNASIDLLPEIPISDNLDGANSKFHDSGIGSSLPSQGSSYAETIMSYGADEERRVRVPPLPAQAKDGEPFECIACGKWVAIRTNTAWKQHVFEDLRPWVCIYPECPVSINPFPTRKDWISHLALEHVLDSNWPSFDCPLCQCQTGQGMSQITKHLSGHLEEISLAALPGEYDADDNSSISTSGDADEDSQVDHASKLRNTEIDEIGEESAVPRARQTRLIGACLRCRVRRIHVSNQAYTFLLLLLQESFFEHSWSQRLITDLTV